MNLATPYERAISRYATCETYRTLNKIIPYLSYIKYLGCHFLVGKQTSFDHQDYSADNS